MKADLSGGANLWQSIPEWLMDALTYRIAMPVTEVRIFTSAGGKKTGYYICPRCHITMEREFVAYCDRCGQRLDWRDYDHAKAVLPTQNCTNT